MPQTLSQTTVKTPEPVPDDHWPLFLRIARATYPELASYFKGPPR